MDDARTRLRQCVPADQLERIVKAAAGATAIVRKVDHGFQANASLMMDVFGSGPTDVSAIAQMRENLVCVLVAFRVAQIECPIY